MTTGEVTHVIYWIWFKRSFIEIVLHCSQSRSNRQYLWTDNCFVDLFETTKCNIERMLWFSYIYVYIIHSIFKTHCGNYVLLKTHVHICSVMVKVLTRLDCDRLRIRALIRSNQRLFNWILLPFHQARMIMEKEQRLVSPVSR